MRQEVSKSINNETLAASTDGKELAQGLQKEVDNTSAFCGSNVKEKLPCELGHLAGKSNEALHNHSLKNFEIGYADAVEATGLAHSRKKRSRGDLEGEVVRECNDAASDIDNKGEVGQNQVLSFDTIDLDVHDGGEKPDDTSFPKNLASQLPDVPIIGQEPGVESCKQMRCQLCDISCHERTALEAHLAGKKHALKLKNSIAKVATSCFTEKKARIADAENGDSQKVSKSETESNVLEDNTSNTEASNDPDSGSIKKKHKSEEQKEFSCGICNIKCNSQKHLDLHFLGKKHATHLKNWLNEDATRFGIGGMVTERCNRSVKKEHEILEEESQCDATSNGAHVAVVENHVSKENISSSAASDCLNTILPGTKSNEQTGYDVHDSAVGGHSAGYPKALLDKGGPPGGLKAWTVGMDDFACAGAQFPTVDALAGRYQVIDKGICNLQASVRPDSKPSGDKVDLEKEHILYELCGTDCGNGTESHIIAKMHASCLLKLLIMDRNACTGAAGTMLGCNMASKGREAALQMNSLCGDPPSQPVSTVDEEVEEQECKLCRVKPSSRKDLDNHLAGRKHGIQLKKSLGRCEVCNVYCGTSKGLKCHTAGKKHASKVRLAQGKGDFSDVDGVISPVTAGKKHASKVWLAQDKGDFSDVDGVISPVRGENDSNSEDALKLRTGANLIIEPMDVQEDGSPGVF